jgi:hypothetical protein
VPGVVKTTESESAFAGAPEANPASSLETVWGTLPFQLKLIVLPAGTSMRFGEKLKSLTTVTSTAISSVGVLVAVGAGG